MNFAYEFKVITNSGEEPYDIWVLQIERPAPIQTADVLIFDSENVVLTVALIAHEMDTNTMQAITMVPEELTQAKTKILIDLGFIKVPGRVIKPRSKKPRKPKPKRNKG